MKLERSRAGEADTQASDHHIGLIRLRCGPSSNSIPGSDTIEIRERCSACEEKAYVLLVRCRLEGGDRTVARKKIGLEPNSRDDLEVKSLFP